LPSQQSVQSVTQLTKLLQSELSDLSQQDEALRKLARGLNLLLRTLPKDTQEGTPGIRMMESLIPLARTPEQSRPEINNFHLLSAKAGAANKRMRRACRIALMETDEAATVDEIYLRIVQRGSFHFDNVYQAAAAIRQTLNLMTAQGEALVVDTNPGRRWKRTNDQDPELE
jgi:hypothetical protein